MTAAWWLDQSPRILVIPFAAYGLLVLVMRWRSTRVMTEDRRFLFLFFILQLATALMSACLKVIAGTPSDVSTWLALLTQSFLAAYLHYSIPRSFRRWHYIVTRRRLRKK